MKKSNKIEIHGKFGQKMTKDKLFMNVQNNIGS